MTQIEFVKCGINGEGIGYINRKPVFCDGVFPGETAEVEIVEEKPSYMRAKLKRILTRAPWRTKNPCPHAHQCGACPLLAMDYQKQLEVKRDLLVEALWKYSHTGKDLVRDIHPSPSILHYRNQCKLPIQQYQGKLVSGMYQPGTNHFCDTDGCLIHEEHLEQLRSRVLAVLNAHHMPAYNATTHTGVRSMVLRTMADESQLTLITGRDTLPQDLIDDLASLGITSIHQSINTAKKDAGFFGSTPRTLYGPDCLSVTICSMPLQLPPASFFQLNTKQAEALYTMAVSKIDRCQVLLEAYCGIGAMSLLAKDKAKSILGIEAVPDAIRCADQNARLNQCSDHVHFQCADSAKGLTEAAARHSIDTLLVDPPRSGMDEAMLKAVEDAKIPRLIYVSCNPATLSRNLADLKKSYEIKTIIPFDLFPNTPLVESITVLQRHGTTDRKPGKSIKRKHKHAEQNNSKH